MNEPKTIERAEDTGQFAGAHGSALVYVSKTPTEPGAYWYRLTNMRGKVWEDVTNLTRCSRGLYMPYRNECAHELAATSDVLWAGPLPTPNDKVSDASDAFAAPLG
jgi:hypothetical protein